MSCIHCHYYSLGFCDSLFLIVVLRSDLGAAGSGVGWGHGVWFVAGASQGCTGGHCMSYTCVS